MHNHFHRHEVDAAHHHDAMEHVHSDIKVGDVHREHTVIHEHSHSHTPGPDHDLDADNKHTHTHRRHR